MRAFRFDEKKVFDDFLSGFFWEDDRVQFF